MKIVHVVGARPNYMKIAPVMAQTELYAALVITDSGGVQEETSFLGVPCLTVRPNTQRPITIELGTNRLVLPQKDLLVEEARNMLTHKQSERTKIPLWDGHASERIVNSILDWYSEKDLVS